jgi:hypothetical protein
MEVFKQPSFLFENQSELGRPALFRANSLFQHIFMDRGAFSTYPVRECQPQIPGAQFQQPVSKKHFFLVYYKTA